MAAITQAAGWRVRQAGGRTTASKDNPRFAPFPSICDRLHLGSRQASDDGRQLRHMTRLGGPKEFQHLAAGFS